MLATSLLSLLLLGLAGVLLDSHRREWLQAGASPAESGSEAGEYAFARSRYRRRCFATATIAAVGVLVALWPVVPREPLWVLGFASLLAVLAMQIFVLGVCDAWASSRFYHKLSRRRMAESTARLREAIHEAGAPQEASPESEVIRA